MPKIRILHSSDLHGAYKLLLNCELDFDVWLDTGDFNPNYGRGPKTGGVILESHERFHQVRWWRYKSLASRLTEWLRGRPAIICPGNHDFIGYSGFLANAGADVHPVSREGFELCGLRWAGFREVSWIEGEWPGETHDAKPVVDEVFENPPDVLVTHSPPGGILDYDPEWQRGWGFPYLESALCYKDHDIRYHFFGHVHAQGGRQAVHGKTTFVNGACQVKLHEVEV